MLTLPLGLYPEGKFIMGYIGGHFRGSMTITNTSSSWSLGGMVGKKCFMFHREEYKKL